MVERKDVKTFKEKVDDLLSLKSYDNFDLRYELENKLNSELQIDKRGQIKPLKVAPIKTLVERNYASFNAPSWHHDDSSYMLLSLNDYRGSSNLYDALQEVYTDYVLSKLVQLVFGGQSDRDFNVWYILCDYFCALVDSKIDANHVFVNNRDYLSNDKLSKYYNRLKSSLTSKLRFQLEAQLRTKLDSKNAKLQAKLQAKVDAKLHFKNNVERAALMCVYYFYLWADAFVHHTLDDLPYVDDDSDDAFILDKKWFKNISLSFDKFKHAFLSDVQMYLPIYVCKYNSQKRVYIDVDYVNKLAGKRVLSKLQISSYKNDDTRTSLMDSMINVCEPDYLVDKLDMWIKGRERQYFKQVSDEADGYSLYDLMFNCENLSSNDSYHDIDRYFYDYAVDILKVASFDDDSKMSFSFVHLFYIITRSSKFIDSWACGSSYTDDKYWKNIAFYLTHVVFNPKVKYNYSHKYYNINLLLYRLFHIYLQVEAVVLKPSTLRDKIIPSICHVLFDSSSKFRMLVYQLDMMSNEESDNLYSWICKQMSASNFALTDASFVRIEKPMCDGRTKELCDKLAQSANKLLSRDDPLSLMYMTHAWSDRCDLFIDEHVLCTMSEIMTAISAKLSTPLVLKSDQLIQEMVTLCNQDEHFEMDESYMAAIKQLATHSVSTLMGKAGTGKTTFLRYFIHASQLVSFKSLSVVGCAMASTAVDNLAESIYQGLSSNKHITLHFETIAGLMYKSDMKDVLSSCDILLIDEYTMPDEESLAFLLRNTPDTCRVVFIGDDGQLPAFTGTPMVPDLQSLNSNVNLFNEIGDARLLTQHRCSISVSDVVDMLRVDDESHQLSKEQYVAKLKQKIDESDDIIHSSIDRNSTEALCESYESLVSDLIDKHNIKPGLSNISCAVPYNTTRIELNFKISNLFRTLLSKSNMGYKFTSDGIRIPIKVSNKDKNKIKDVINDDYYITQYDRVILTSKFIHLSDDLSDEEVQEYSDDQHGLYTICDPKHELEPDVYRMYNEHLSRNMYLYVQSISVTGGLTHGQQHVAYYTNSINGKDIKIYRLTPSLNPSNYKGDSTVSDDDLQVVLGMINHPDVSIIFTGQSAYSILHHLDLGYASTVHKAQGATYDYVFTLLPSINGNTREFITQNMLYTAFTRPRLKLYIFDHDCSWMDWVYEDDSYAYSDTYLVFELFVDTKYDLHQLSSSNQ